MKQKLKPTLEIGRKTNWMEINHISSHIFKFDNSLELLLKQFILSLLVISLEISICMLLVINA